ncbi:MAG: hypothetical protein ABFC94_00460 [Syntrophomonas sp.]
MRVRDLLGIVIRVKRIFEIYADSKLEDMLDDIYMKVQGSNDCTGANLAADEIRPSVIKPSSRKKSSKEFNPMQIVETIPQLSKSEITIMLNELKIAEIKTVATLAGITIPGTAKRKGEMVDFIANFYGMHQVHQHMAHR